MKSNIKILILISVASIASLAFLANAGTSYNLLQPLPTTGDNPDFGYYMEGLIRFLVLFSAVAAVVMITIGGVLYAFSEALETQKTARSMISDALLGLIIALLSYLILYTINPDLVNLKLTIPGLPRSASTNSPSQGPPGTGGTGTGGTGTASTCTPIAAAQVNGQTVHQFRCNSNGAITQSGVSSNEAFNRCAATCGLGGRGQTVPCTGGQIIYKTTCVARVPTTCQGPLGGTCYQSYEQCIDECTGGAIRCNNALNNACNADTGPSDSSGSSGGLPANSTCVPGFNQCDASKGLVCGTNPFNGKMGVCYKP